MGYSMHNDSSGRIRRLLPRIALNNAAALRITSEMDGIFQNLTDLTMKCFAPSHLVWPLDEHVWSCFRGKRTVKEEEEFWDVNSQGKSDIFLERIKYTESVD